jgi:hypothetical protein
MSYAAEPYAQFVEDLLTSMTGGVARERFVFIPEQAPFRLSPPGPLVPSTLRVYGQIAGAFVRFVRDTDFILAIVTDAQKHVDSYTIQWNMRPGGVPAGGATLPEQGTPFYVNYDHTGPGGATPILSDRNPGSVVRLLSESFAREYAVVSRQLEAVYKAAFLDTSTGRDLDQLVALLGLVRRDRSYAVGSAVFARTTPAPADVFVPAGTKLSTSQPPAVVFETTADATLQRGNLSVEAPIRAAVKGASGTVAANLVSVIHRPILGVETVSNPQATQLFGADESDDDLRTRARRALESGGKATLGALLGALSTLSTVSGDALPQVREKDILIQEDHANRPGVIVLNIAAQLSDATAQQAIQLIEETRPAGVRVVHNFDAQSADAVVTPGDGLVNDDEEVPADATAVSNPLFFPLKIIAVVLPVSATLSPAERDALRASAETALRAAVGQAGVGEVLIYNRLIAALMSLDGVLDVALQLFKVPDPHASPPELPTARHMNLRPPKTLRPSVEKANGGVLEVNVGGELVAFDVIVRATLQNAYGGGTDGDKENARVDISARLRDKIYTLTKADPAALIAAIGVSNDFTVTNVSYTVWYRQAGVQIGQTSPTITPKPEEILWINSVKLVVPPS